MQSMYDVLLPVPNVSVSLPRSKSPSFVSSPNLYSDALNASLQSALGFGGGSAGDFLNHHAAAMQQHNRDRDEKHAHLASLER